MQEHTICFALGKNNVERSRLLPYRAKLIEKLAERGVASVVAHSYDGDQPYDFMSEVDVWQPAFDNLGKMRVTSLGRTVLSESMDAVVNYYRTLSAPAHLPVINKGAVRRYGLDKAKAFTDIFVPLDLGISTFSAKNKADVVLALDTIESSRVVVKPIAGISGKGVVICERHELHDWAAKITPDDSKPYIVQPYVDFTQSFPSMMKPYTTAEREHYEELSATGRSKELRMYSFYSSQGIDCFPVARASAQGDRHMGEDNWFFVDPESVPSILVDDSTRVISRLAALTNAKSIYAATDWGYGAIDGADPAWSLIETNVRTPYLLGYDKHSEVADMVHELFAMHITAAAQL